MDANGQKFWMVRGDGWQVQEPESFDLTADHFRLASEMVDHDYAEVISSAEARLELVPMARDTFGGRAFYDAATAAICGTSEIPGSAKIVDLPTPATDLALGYDGWLYIATSGSVLVLDVRGRYPSTKVTLAGFDAWRLAPKSGGGMWVLDRKNKKLAYLIGQLWPAPLALIVPPDAFQPVEENPNPFQLTLMSNPWLDVGEDPVGLASDLAGRLAVLLWFTNPSDSGDLEARIRRLEGGTSGLGSTVALNKIKRPFSFAWITQTRFAVMAAGVAEAVVYNFPDEQGNKGIAEKVNPIGEIYPLRDHDGGPFLHGVSLPTEYPAAPAPRPLVSVSLPAFVTNGIATLKSPLDSRMADTAWHRFYVEAEIPPETSFTLHAAASDQESDPTKIAASDWHPHQFGALSAAPSAPVDQLAVEGSRFDRAPLAAWVPAESEIPGFEGFLDEEGEKNQRGLFTILIQRRQRPVRTLRGRYLHLRVELRGSGRDTPCIHAIRAYAPRFSYQDKYLPALYREQIFGSQADRTAPGESPTPADFLGRMLANFEGVLTPLEDKIADAWLLTDPSQAPESGLAWLGEWIGVAFEPWYPADRRRQYLQQAPDLFRRRGTLSGLRLALDVATSGGVLGDSQGRRRIVVVEDYWMRRTLATVLGVNLDRNFDPLFGGPVYTGNSRVGRTLFLNEGTKRELLALFDAAIPLNPDDQATVDAFFASLASRATVIVHDTVQPDELLLIQRVAAMETPADTIVNVRRASQDFMVGLAALVGVDSYLRPGQLPAAVAVEASAVGEAFLLRPPSLDPRIEGISL